MNPRTPIATLLLLAALVISACGGDDSAPISASAPQAKSAAKDPEADAVIAAAKTVITDPAKTCSLLTPTALETFTGGTTGDAGQQKCQEQVDAGSLPTEANIVLLDVQGANASVGYTTDQVTGAMQLVKQDGGWLMNRITTIPAP